MPDIVGASFTEFIIVTEINQKSGTRSKKNNKWKMRLQVFQHMNWSDLYLALN